MVNQLGQTRGGKMARQWARTGDAAAGEDREIVGKGYGVIGSTKTLGLRKAGGGGTLLTPLSGESCFNEFGMNDRHLFGSRTGPDGRESGSIIITHVWSWMGHGDQQ